MAEVKVNGMSCQHCVKSVTDALDALDGVINVSVDLASGIAKYDEEKPVPEDAVKEAIRKIGFETE
ncbi:heavy-metal-associated domain-containing protein [Salidesulfovibrio onnuriiensis]|uniref:heavy-metal-associated domain-containing protein n=1 Tax=Salidesulfovibrio onnuriiensis TaxID=2583823 RepID=UPI0011C9026C|nr:cation transporter [Salidesulfovibrio onnuriiensis]